MGTRNFRVTVPANEMVLFQEIVNRMGWRCNPSTSFLDEYMATRPNNVPITEEEILAEVAAVRYSK